MKRIYTASSLLKSGLAFWIFLFSASDKAAAQSPPNIDFSGGNFSNWTCLVGSAATGTPTTGAYFDSAKISAPISGHAPGIDPVTSLHYLNESRHFITSGSDTDFYGGFPIVSPVGGSYSLRIGNDSANFRSDRVQYYIHVPAATTSFNLQCQYAIVMQDPLHVAEQQPTFQVIAYDSATGTVLSAANNLYIAHYNFPGFMFSRASHGAYSLDSIFYLPWTSSTINLSGMGGKTVTLECTALDCSQGGHFCYGYFDVVSSSNSLAARLVKYNTKGDSAVLEGPAGYKSYHWYNQNFSAQLNAANDTSRIKTLPTPATKQYYNLVITPYASIGVPDTIQSPVLNALPLGVAGVFAEGLNVYPNPVTSTLHIEFPSVFDGTISLWNPEGQNVYNATVSHSLRFDIRTAQFAEGLYQLVIKDSQGNANTLNIAISH